MSDNPKTIEHDPLEQHRGKPIVGQDLRREPFFGSGLFPFVLTIVVGLTIAYFVKVPLGWLSRETCDRLNFCTIEESPLDR